MKPQYLPTYILILTLSLLSACASAPGSAPVITDLDRDFFTQQAVVRTLKNSSSPEKAEDRAEAYLKLANALDIVSGSAEGVAAITLEIALESVIDTEDMAQEDKDVIEYLSKRILAEFQLPDMTSPLTDEQRRIIGVYSTAIKDGVNLWKAGQ